MKVRKMTAEELKEFLNWLTAAGYKKVPKGREFDFTHSLFKLGAQTNKKEFKKFLSWLDDNGWEEKPIGVDAALTFAWYQCETMK